MTRTRRRCKRRRALQLSRVLRSCIRWLSEHRSHHRGGVVEQAEGREGNTPTSPCEENGVGEVFEQHERWLEELRSHVDRNEAIVESSGHMNLVAIAAEIVNADADERKLQKIHIPNWVSMAKDLQDTLNYLGPETSRIVEQAAVDLVAAINDLFTETTGEDDKAQTRIEHDRRPQVKAAAAALYDILNHDNTIVSSWRDLVSACQNPDHIAYSYDRIAVLRDNVVALQEHRRQDPGHWGLITTAVDILIDYPFSVHRAQVHVGDIPISPDVRRQGEPTGLTDDQRMDLAERWIVRRPFTRDVVVWLRIANAYPQRTGCTVHGNIAFYAAQSFAGGIIDHTVARQIYTRRSRRTAHRRDQRSAGE
jgi:hypothetical protein